MELEKNTNLVTQQLTLQQQTSVSPTIDVYGSKVNRNDFINYINLNADSFFNTYSNMWSNKLKQLLLQLKDALINNIANGNITRIGNNSMDITNIDNSGIDSTQGGAGLIIVGMADKVAQEVHNQLEAAKPHKKWTDSTLQLSWLNYFYGGKDPGNYQSWVDRDVKNDKGKRATTNRLAAIREWLNTINPADYTSGLDSFGGLEEFANRLNALKQSLADGTIDNNDYTAADRLGFGNDLRTLLSDDIVSLEDTNANANRESTQLNSTQPTTDDEIIANAWNGGDQRDIYKLVANTIRNWKKGEYSTRIAKASYDSATNYLTNRNKLDKSGSYNVHDTNAQLTYYSTKFFPAFFLNFKKEQFFPEYVNNHNNPINTWKGLLGIWQYIADNLTLAIRNRMYGNGTLLGKYANELNPVLGLDGKPTGFWTVPESFNETTGTEFIYNPDTGEYKRISLSDPKYKYLMLSYLLGKGINLLLTLDLSQDLSQAYKEGGKIDKLQYGGEFILGAFDNPLVTSLSSLGVLAAPTAQLIALLKKLLQLLALEQALLKLQQLKENFWKGNEGKQFHSAGEFYNSLTLLDKRELKAAAADLGAIAANIAGAATAAPTAGIGAVAGGVTSAGLGLYAAYKRAQNRYDDDGKFDLGDIGATALDSGMALAGLIPGVGAAAKTGSLATKFGKVAHITLAGLGAMGLLNSYPGAKRAAENIIAGKMPSTTDLQDFTSALTMLTGATTYKGANHVLRTILKNAAANGRVIQSATTPESWTYKFLVKDKNGVFKPLQITLADKLLVNNLKSAIKNEKTDEILSIIKNNDSKFLNTKVEDLSFTKMSKLEGLKANITDDIAGITHNKAVLGGTTFTKYQKGEDYNTYNGNKKISNLELKLWNTSVGLGNKINSLNPHWNNLNWKQKIFGRTNDDVFEQYTPKQQTDSTSPTESVQPKPASTGENGTQAPPTNNPTEGSTSTPQAPPSFNVDEYKNAIIEKVSPILHNSTNSIDGDELEALIKNPKFKDNFNKLDNADKTLINNIIDSSKDGNIVVINDSDRRQHIKDLILDIVINKNDPNIDAVKAAKEALAAIKFKKGGILYAKDGVLLPWYSTLLDYDPTKYTTQYGNTLYGINANNQYTGNLVYGNAGNGLGTSRYKPDSRYSDFTITGLNNAKNIENLQYYKLFTNDLVNSYNLYIANPTDKNNLFYRWAHAVDATLPKGSLSTFFDNNDKLRTSWDIKNNDSYGRNTILKYTNGLDYLLHNRNDLLLANRHNDLLKEGIRYFYTDNTGNKHWVSPEDALKYTISKNGITSINGNTKWTDYEIINPTKLGGANPDTMLKSHVLTDVLNGLKNHLPDIAEATRVGWNNRFNNRLRDYLLQHMNPVLLLPYAFYRKIYGDYGTMSEYNRQGANTLNVANTIASNTADSSLAAATLLLGASQANDLAIKGKLADNLMIRDTYEKALALNNENLLIANSVANTNIKNLNDNDRERAQVVLATNTMNHLNWDKFWQAQDLKAQHALDERDAMLKYLDYATIMNNNSRAWDPLVKEITNKYRLLYLDATTDEERQVIADKMQEELTSLGYLKLDSLLNALALLRGLNYSYTPTWKAKVTIPSTATPSYKSKGGTIDYTRLATNAVKEKNKDIERMYKDWSKKDDIFFNLLGKLRQAKFNQIIKLK